MRQATIAELKAKLSEYVAAVKEGDVVVVTERGRPVARLVPLGDETGMDARAVALVRAGVLGAPRRKLARSRFLAAARPADPRGVLLEAVLVERAEGQ